MALKQGLLENSLLNHMTVQGKKGSQFAADQVNVCSGNVQKTYQIKIMTAEYCIIPLEFDCQTEEADI